MISFLLQDSVINYSLSLATQNFMEIQVNLFAPFPIVIIQIWIWLGQLDFLYKNYLSRAVNLYYKKSANFSMPFRNLQNSWSLINQLRARMQEKIWSKIPIKNNLPVWNKT